MRKTQEPEKPQQKVIVVQAPATPGAAAVGLALSILGLFSCGILSIPAFFLCALSVAFDKGPKSVGLIGLVLSLPGLPLFSFVGLGFLLAIFGITGASKIAKDISTHNQEFANFSKNFDDAKERKQIEKEAYWSESPPSTPIIRVHRPDSGSPPEPEPRKYRKGYSVRTWRDKTGKYSTVGEMKSFSNWDVVIIKSDGTEAKVPREKLSDEDLEYIKSGWKSDEKMVRAN